MAKIEFDEDMIALINEAKPNDKTLEEFVNSVFRNLAADLKRRVIEKKKVENFIESYKHVPQKPDEYEDWQEEGTGKVHDNL